MTKILETKRYECIKKLDRAQVKKSNINFKRPQKHFYKKNVFLIMITILSKRIVKIFQWSISTKNLL